MSKNVKINHLFEEEQMSDIYHTEKAYLDMEKYYKQKQLTLQLNKQDEKDNKRRKSYKR